MKRRSRKSRNNREFSDASIMLVFLVFVVLVIFFFDGSKSLQTAQEPEGLSLQEEQQTILSKLVIDHERQDGPAIIVGNAVNARMLDKVASTNYEQLKRLFGVESEFVIYFEDEEGNIIAVGEKPCIGSQYAYVNGRRCSE